MPSRWWYPRTVASSFPKAQLPETTRCARHLKYASRDAPFHAFIYTLILLKWWHRIQCLYRLYMILLLALLYSLQQTIDAAPEFITKIALNITTAPISPPNILCPNTRSVWNIIWTCVSTIFACAWVSVHPNIPAPRTKEWHVGLKRLELMVWTIIAPEMMIFWAIRQWVGARKLAKRYKGESNHFSLIYLLKGLIHE